MRRILPVLLLTATPVLAAAETPDVPTALVDSVWRLGDRALSAVDATPQQRRRVVQLAHEAMGALQPHEQPLRTWGADLHRTLTAETVSHDQTEALRRRGIALADAMSADTVATLTDMANTLDAAQRRELLRLARREAARTLR